MKIIFEQDRYKVTLQHNASEKGIDLLKQTLWGTKETLYQHQDTEQNIVKVPEPFFFNLEKQDELIGTCCFSKRSIRVHGRVYDCWYSRYFSIASKRQGGIFGHMILKQVRKYFEAQTHAPSVFYAFVDVSNMRSHKLVSYLGFKKIRSFETFSFSRLFPEKDKRVVLLADEDQEKMLALLQESYSNYIGADFDTHFFAGNYYVLKNGNEIIAGIRANKAHWVIRSLSGLSGAIIIKVLPYIPILSRLFNPNAFRFAAFDGMYCKAGNEKDFFILMESVCASLNVNTGLTWLDTQASLYHRLKHAGNWGIMEKLKEKIPAYVAAAFKNVPEEEQEQISNFPAYISAIDII